MISNANLSHTELLKIFELKLGELSASIQSTEKNKSQHQTFLRNIDELRVIISFELQKNESERLENILNAIADRTNLKMFSPNTAGPDTIFFIANCLQAISAVGKNIKKDGFFLFTKTNPVTDHILAFEASINRFLKYPQQALTDIETAELNLVQGKYQLAMENYQKISKTNKEKESHYTSLAEICLGLVQLEKLKDPAHVNVSNINELDSFLFKLLTDLTYDRKNIYFTGLLEKMDEMIKHIKADYLFSSIKAEYPRTSGINVSYLRVRMMIRELYGHHHFKFAIDKVLGLDKDEQSVIDLEAGLKDFLSEGKVKDLFTLKVLQSFQEILHNDTMNRHTQEKTNFSDELHLSADDRRELNKYFDKLQEITQVKLDSSKHLINSNYTIAL